jgi:hypothetical protein
MCLQDSNETPHPTRAARIDTAVGEALQPFFGK